VSGCSSPTVIVTGVQPVAAAFDESKVYWSQRNDVNSNIYTCPLTGCAKGTPILATDAIDIAVDATRIYWIVGDVTYPRSPIAIMSAPKDGSAAPTMLAAHQNQAASLVLRDEFVYWVTSFTVGAVARCPVAGCPSDGPELLSRDQHFPHFVNPDGHALFWMNGASAPDKPSSVERPVQIMGCQLSNCASSTEVLDEGLGGGYGVRAAATWKSFEAVSSPPREMVVDSEAIYWMADVVNAGVAGAPLGSVVDVAIRRTERRR
jgi:hypothetical protein